MVLVVRVAVGSAVGVLDGNSVSVGSSVEVPSGDGAAGTSVGDTAPAGDIAPLHPAKNSAPSARIRNHLLLIAFFSSCIFRTLRKGHRFQAGH